MCSQSCNLSVNQLNVLCYFIIESDLWLTNITKNSSDLSSSLAYAWECLQLEGFLHPILPGVGVGNHFHMGLHPEFFVCYVVYCPNTYMFIYIAYHN